MDLTTIIDRIQNARMLHGELYEFYVEIATLAVLLYVGYTDLRTFKIRNDAVLLLFVLYVFLALISRSWLDVLFDVGFAAVMFAVLLWFYANKLIGGGDVKFMAVVCLWVGGHCALLFSAFLLFFIGVHLGAARMGWVQSKSMAGRRAIPYAPSVAGALGAVIVLGCLRHQELGAAFPEGWHVL